MKSRASATVLKINKPRCPQHCARAHTHTRTHACTHKNARNSRTRTPRTHTLSHSPTHTYILHTYHTLKHTHTQIHSPSLSLSHTHILHSHHTHSNTHIDTHTLSHSHTHHTHAHTYTNAHTHTHTHNPSHEHTHFAILRFHPRATKIYTRLQKPHYLGTAFPIYSCRSPYSRIASSVAQRPKICRRFYKIKETSTDFHCISQLPPYTWSSS